MKTIKTYGAKGKEFIMELGFEHYKNVNSYQRIHKEMLTRPEFQSQEHQKVLKEIITENQKYINKLKIQLDL